MTSNDRFLRYSLRGNAAFSTACAIASVAAAEPLAGALGVPDPSWLTGLGVQLLLFAAFLIWLSTRERIAPAVAWGVIAADAAWVVGTVPVVLAGVLTTAGIWTALAIADCVAAFAVLQTIGVFRMRRVAAATA